MRPLPSGMGGYNRKASVPTPRSTEASGSFSRRSNNAGHGVAHPPPTSAERSATRADTRVCSLYPAKEPASSNPAVTQG